VPLSTQWLGVTRLIAEKRILPFKMVGEAIEVRKERGSVYAAAI
jgi:hypothetical protein